MAMMFSVAGKQLCEPCAKSVVTAPGAKFTRESFYKLTDPTVCAKCGQDFGDIELATVAKLPVCESCEQALRYRPFPTWVKMSFVGVCLLAVVSFVYNWRFFAAYVEVRRASTALHRGDISEAVRLSSAATAHVPDSVHLRILSHFILGLRDMKDDRAGDALAHFHQVQILSPDWPNIDSTILRAENSAAFDRQDYDAFLATSKKILDQSPTDPMSIGTVASAYACKYAATGDASYKQQSLDYLNRAKGLSTGRTKELYDEYEQRILFRLDTRRIISRQAFLNEFPNGYHPTEKTP